MAGKEYQIAALWMEGSLSFLEQLCLKSFVDAGHHVKLYHYGPLQNVPDGMELADASVVLPRTDFLAHARTGSPALHSDLFRYKMLEQEKDTIWADTDAYCMKKFETPNGHFYGWESEKHINGGVLGLPSDCDTLGELLEFTSDEFAIPTWYGDEYTRELEEKRDAGDPVHASEQPWGVWGPHAVTHFLHKTGEAKYALPQEGLYPVTYKDRRNMLKRNFDMTPYITENTFSVHLYGRRMRARLVEKEGGAPHPKSLLGQLIKKHDIDPEAAPLPPSRAQKAAAEGRVEEKTPKVKVPKAAKSKPVITVPKVAPIDQSERAGIGLVNLTDIADKYEVDKGSKRHRYTDMYQMLFSPLRTRKLNVMEMGLQDGGPEHEFPVNRKTTDAPSIRMWLEYFPKAEVFGLDVCDFSWLKEDRFTFVQCDMDARENIATAAKDLPKMDIIVDDASHASHHQQNAFLELFPKMASGGIYAIESLRWQPKHMETKGFTKTADLFYGYQKDGAFSHSDKEIEAELNGLRKHISGCFMYQVGYDKSRKDQFMVIQKR
ncbi:hypothetical protein [Amylibacter sp. IMCC11727]|uniref:hypothetical protein n=1 Tax=Amylibacter sp. IMCC11727 TaxID=3039851 RepID=UPI00244DD24E|nr:hypothetical protein [Amylibacter sp. IMCC11727]WGI22369.1 hypothetical protein QBD29_02835 [Amylibacter sp. IMCC11727]